MIKMKRIFLCIIHFSSMFPVVDMFHLDTTQDSRLTHSVAVNMAYIERDSDAASRSSCKSLDTSKKEGLATKREFTGAGTLGDIMSDLKQENNVGLSCAGLVTTDGGTLAEKYGIQSRLDRMALTANGNLQRLFSSYYDAPIHVVIDKCNQKTQKTWNRLVHLTVFDQVRTNSKVLLTAKSNQSQQDAGVLLGKLHSHYS